MKKYVTRAFLIGVVISLFILPSPEVSASNPKVGSGALEREMRGSSYWQSSNLREWLNSDRGSGQVRYTNQPPSKDKLGSYAYDHEPGFLYEFTTEEKNAIAVTEHRVIVSSYDLEARDGGSRTFNGSYHYGPSLTFSLPGLSQLYVEYYYQKLNNKVFLLNPYEIQ